MALIVLRRLKAIIVFIYLRELRFRGWFQDFVQALSENLAGLPEKIEGSAGWTILLRAVVQEHSAAQEDEEVQTGLRIYIRDSSTHACLYQNR